MARAMQSAQTCKDARWARRLRAIRWPSGAVQGPVRLLADWQAAVRARPSEPEWAPARERPGLPQLGKKTSTSLRRPGWRSRRALTQRSNNRVREKWREA